MKEIFPCPIIPKAARKSLYEQPATFFTLPTEAWALFLSNRWSHILVLGWVIPETPNLSCITMEQNCSPPITPWFYWWLCKTLWSAAQQHGIRQSPIIWWDSSVTRHSLISGPSSCHVPLAHCVTQWAELWFARRKVEVLETSFNSVKLRTSSSTESHNST